MTRRAVAMLLTGHPAERPGGASGPPGLDPVALNRAMAADVADLLTELVSVDPLVVTSTACEGQARQLGLSARQVVVLPVGSGPPEAFDALGRSGYQVAALVVPDAPDLPGLVLAKTLSAVSTAVAAAAPAAHGGLVVLCSRLPAPAWLTDSGVDLDTPDAVDRLRAAVPRRTELSVTSGWHRVRQSTDLEALDPGLEGWPATRTLLGHR